MRRYPALLLDVRLMAIRYWWVAPATCQESFQQRFLWRLLTDEVWSYYLLVIGRPHGLCTVPHSPSPSVCSYQHICCQKREEAGEGKGESDGEHNNISIPSSLQNFSRSKSNPSTAEHHRIKDVSRVADATCQTRDGVILAKSDSTFAA